MAYIVGKFKYHSCSRGDEGLILPYEEGSTQTFKAGELVKLSSGQIVVATEASADIILGYVLADATGTQGTLLPVQVIRPSDVFIVPYESDDTFATADIGAAGYGAKRTSNAWYINQDNTTAAQVVFQVLGTAEIDVRAKKSPTAGGSAYVRFNPSNLQFSVDV